MGRFSDLDIDRQEAEAAAALVDAQGEPLVRERRVRLYRFAPQALIDLGTSDRTMTVARGRMPADAKADAVIYDMLRDCFIVRVASESFDPVPEGELIPFADEPTWFAVEQL